SFLHHTRPPATYTLSLHDALPIFQNLSEAADTVTLEAALKKIATLQYTENLSGKPASQNTDDTEEPVPNPQVIDIGPAGTAMRLDRKSTRLNSSHVKISYAVFCLK